MKPETPRLTNELANALSSPFPIRGWHFDYSLTPEPSEHRYKIYTDRPEYDPETREIRGETPPYENLLSSHMKITARQRIPKKMMFLGRMMEFPAQVEIEQFVRLNFEQVSLAVEFDPKKVLPIEKEDIWIPDSAAYTNIVERWARKKKAAQTTRDVRQAMFVMAELFAVRENYLRHMRAVLQSMAQLIQSRTVDYWTLIEGVLTKGLIPADVQEESKGVISFKSIGASRSSLDHQVNAKDDTIQ